MSAQQPYEVGHKVHILLTSGQVSTKRFEIVKVWRYPSTFRYLLDTGYVADHSELRATDADPAAPATDSSAAAPPAPTLAEPESDSGDDA